MEVIKYRKKYKDGTPIKVLTFSLDECLGWGGMGICDLCGEAIFLIGKRGYFVPAMMCSNAMCEKCYNEDRKVYEEDKGAFNEDNFIKTYLKFDKEGIKNV